MICDLVWFTDPVDDVMANAQVSVLLAGRHVRGSPFMVDVGAGPLCPHNCQLLGMPDLPSSGDASRLSLFWNHSTAYDA